MATGSRPQLWRGAEPSWSPLLAVSRMLPSGLLAPRRRAGAMGSDSAFLRSADAPTAGPACPGRRRGQESGRHRPKPTFARPEASGMKKGRLRGEGGGGAGPTWEPTAAPTWPGQSGVPVVGSQEDRTSRDAPQSLGQQYSMGGGAGGRPRGLGGDLRRDRSGAGHSRTPALWVVPRPSPRPRWAPHLGFCRGSQAVPSASARRRKPALGRFSRLCCSFH